MAGGEVTKAKRLEKGKNVRWEIHVRPDTGCGTTGVRPYSQNDCARRHHDSHR